MSDNTRIRWGRIVAGAFLMEILLIILSIPILGWTRGRLEPIVPFVPLTTVVSGIAAAWWVGRKPLSAPVLHGVLVGLLANVIYLVMVAFAPGGLTAVVAAYGMFMWVLSNGMKVVGAVAGILIGQRR